LGQFSRPVFSDESAISSGRWQTREQLSKEISHVYVEKLAAILSIAQIRGLSIVRMEVPCCAGLVRIAEAAQQLTGRAVPVEEIVITIHGQSRNSAESVNG
jgi:hypothetical protein